MPSPSNTTFWHERARLGRERGARRLEVGKQIGALVGGEHVLRAGPLQRELADLIARARIGEQRARPLLDARRVASSPRAAASRSSRDGVVPTNV